MAVINIYQTLPYTWTL